MDTIHHLKKLLYEKTEEVKIRDETISLLERELDDKDAQIRHLRNEIDKFRQVNILKYQNFKFSCSIYIFLFTTNCYLKSEISET